MANPRKFSEKIALHKQRQAEEQASYERVLMEVRSVTNPGQAGTNAGSTVVPNQANNPVPAAVASNNHMGPRMPRLQMPPSINQPTNTAKYHWGSMPNIHDNQNHLPSLSNEYYGQYANGQMASSQSNMHPMQYYPQQQQQQQQQAPQRHQMNNSISNFPSMNNQMYLDPQTCWNGQLTSPTQPIPSPIQVENGNVLSRATSDSALHHSVLHKINQDKQKTLLSINSGRNNVNKQRKPESSSLRRLRPPQLTPQGAQSGSLPDLTNLHIPSSPSTPPTSNHSGEDLLKSRPLRGSQPSIPPQAAGVNSPRPSRRPHPYVQSRGYQMGGGSGSSPSSPIAPQMSSLPASPLQYLNKPDQMKKNTLSPSPVPEIVLTPSDQSDGWDASSQQHPLQLSNQYQSPNEFAFQTNSNQSLDLISNGGEFGFLDQIVNQQPVISSNHPPNQPGSPFNHQPQPLQGLIAAPNEQQLNVLENRKWP